MKHLLKLITILLTIGTFYVIKSVSPPQLREMAKKAIVVDPKETAQVDLSAEADKIKNVGTQVANMILEDKVNADLSKINKDFEIILALQKNFNTKKVITVDQIKAVQTIPAKMLTSLKQALKQLKVEIISNATAKTQDQFITQLEILRNNMKTYIGMSTELAQNIVNFNFSSAPKALYIQHIESKMLQLADLMAQLAEYEEKENSSIKLFSSHFTADQRKLLQGLIQMWQKIGKQYDIPPQSNYWKYTKIALMCGAAVITGYLCYQYGDKALEYVKEAQIPIVSSAAANVQIAAKVTRNALKDAWNLLKKAGGAVIDLFAWIKGQIKGQKEWSLLTEREKEFLKYLQNSNAFVDEVHHSPFKYPLDKQIEITKDRLGFLREELWEGISSMRGNPIPPRFLDINEATRNKLSIPTALEQATIEFINDPRSSMNDQFSKKWWKELSLWEKVYYVQWLLKNYANLNTFYRGDRQELIRDIEKLKLMNQEI